jgi:hypothetical protein
MIAFELLVGTAVDTRVSVAFQNDAAYDVPVIWRQTPPIERTYVLKAFGNSWLRPAQQRQY